MNFLELTEKWEKAAWQFGGEAAANNLSNLFTAEDKEAVANYYPNIKGAWLKIPVEAQQKARLLFREGYASEKKQSKRR